MVKIKDVVNTVQEKMERKRRKKELVHKYSTTPLIIVETISDYIDNNKDSDLKVEDVIDEIGNYLRKTIIDLGKRDSSGICQFFSLRLRDTYNHVFDQLSMPFQAYLIAGDFKVEKSFNHHWVAILPSNTKLTKTNIGKMAIYVDGTADQYEDWYELSQEEREYIWSHKLLIIGPEGNDNVRALYNFASINQLSKIWFKEDENNRTKTD